MIKVSIPRFSGTRNTMETRRRWFGSYIQHNDPIWLIKCQKLPKMTIIIGIQSSYCTNNFFQWDRFNNIQFWISSSTSSTWVLFGLSQFSVWQGPHAAV
jgi:hypothetical protein